MFSESLVVLAVGILIRIGLPLLLTVVLVRALHRLDERWQAEEKRKSEVQARSPIRIQSLKCWEIRDCAASQRENCRAYKNPQIPCWQHFRNGNGELQEICLECEIFRNAPLAMAA